jgi:hypothetical protein
MKRHRLDYIHVLVLTAALLYGCATQAAVTGQPPAACEETTADTQQEPSDPLAPLKERIDLLVGQLADEKYFVRVEADRELRELLCNNVNDLPHILPSLRPHLDPASDPEVEVRLKRIVKVFFLSWARTAFRDGTAESARFDVYWRKWLEKVAGHYGQEVVQMQSDRLILVPMAKITMTIYDADMRILLNQIAAIGGAEVFIAPDAKGTVSIVLRDVPWRSAFEIIVKTLNYRIMEDGHNRFCVVRP